MIRVFRIIRMAVTALLLLLILPFVLLWAGVRWLVFKLCFVVNARKVGVPLRVAIRL